MAVQHKYTSPVQVTENVARVEAIILRPNVVRNGQIGVVEITYVIGEETGGNFTQTDQKLVSLDYTSLPAGTQTTLATLESQALTYGENNAVFPAGSEEAIP